MGQNVMVSRFNRFFNLVDYFKQFKMIKLRIVVGLPTFMKILDSSYYTDLSGELLEAMGTLFQKNVKVYLYPSLNPETKEVIHAEQVIFSHETRNLWEYLKSAKKIVPINNATSKHLGITTEKVSQLIEAGDPTLEDYLPEKVLKQIVEKGLFGYNERASSKKDF
jgi:hypothetical protein